MTKKPKYYRARIALIERLISEMDADDPSRSLLRNGVFPDFMDGDGLIQEMINEQDISSEPLSFWERTSFNTWFALHPDKVAGKEVITSSREFPLTIKGSKEDISQCIEKTLADDFSFSLELKKRASMAKLKLLAL
jgi:hypothetical protein